ncbi:HAD family hydrolase [Actinoplanes sp. NPDC051470]|uniref:HAD family hydrolase n=1 Tax=unclassified Actinoplanes TaxID=2626549 RepID=UPI00343B562F
MSELLISDLDGTLLRPDGTLGARSVDTINRFLADGGLFTYATARSFASAGQVTAALDLTLPVITYGGAMIVDPRTGAARPPRLLDAAVVETVLAHTTAHPDLQPVLFVMREDRDRLCFLADLATPAMSPFLQTRRDDPRLLPLTSWAEIDPATVISIALLGDPARLAPLRTALEVHAAICHTVYSEDVYVRGTWWLELTSERATKAAALAEVREEVGATSLICFGDSPNDLPMFAVADRAVAMANGVPEVRAAAHEVIGGNADEAVAAFIENLRTVLPPAASDRC